MYQRVYVISNTAFFASIKILSRMPSSLLQPPIGQRSSFSFWNTIADSELVFISTVRGAEYICTTLIMNCMANLNYLTILYIPTSKCLKYFTYPYIHTLQMEMVPGPLKVAQQMDVMLMEKLLVNATILLLLLS